MHLVAEVDGDALPLNQLSAPLHTPRSAQYTRHIELLLPGADTDRGNNLRLSPESQNLILVLNVLHVSTLLGSGGYTIE